MNKALTLAGLMTAFAALPATAHEWTSYDRNKMLNHMMSKMDANGDGVISRSEHEAAAEEMFNNADTNHDNVLTKQELSDYKTKDRQDAGMPLYAVPDVTTNPHPHKDR